MAYGEPVHMVFYDPDKYRAMVKSDRKRIDRSWKAQHKRFLKRQSVLIRR